ncbi:MAG: menaquinone biosynthesis protein [Thermodesulfobacteriota bacterium]
MEQIRIGKFSFINTSPIYYPLEHIVGLNGFQVIEGSPSELNARFFRGELDISVISSQEYGLHAEKYFLLPELAIVSQGTVKSVLFFSKYPLKALSGRRILITEKSQTSVALLKIILEEFYEVFPIYETGDLSAKDVHSREVAGFLAIGDEALRFRIESQEPYIIDLGETWKKFAGLPFVYAVWAVRREFYNQFPQKVWEACRLLKESRDKGLKTLEKIGGRFASHIPMSKEACLAYLRTLCFDLTPEALEGMRLFFRYLVKRGEYPSPVNIEFVPQLDGMTA